MKKSKSKVLVIGATGFTGSYVVERLMEMDTVDLTLYIRSQAKLDGFGFDKARFSVVVGNLEDHVCLRRALTQQDIVIYVASLGFGHAQPVVKLMLEANIKKAVFTSTTGVFTKLNPSSKSIRLDAEAFIHDSGLNYTIIRPTMIYGSRRDRNMWSLIRFVKKMPFIPVFGGGMFLQQPIFVKDLASVIISSCFSIKADKKKYNVAGKIPLTFNDVISIVRKKLDTFCFMIHIPFKLSILIASVLELVFSKPPIKVEQVRRLNEDKSFSYEDAQRDLDFNPVSFEEGITEEIDCFKGDFR